MGVSLLFAVLTDVADALRSQEARGRDFINRARRCLALEHHAVEHAELGLELETKHKLLSEHGSQYYATIGRKGGLKTDTKPKGFEANPALARIAGRKGGKK